MKTRSLRNILAIRSVWIAVVPFILSAILGWFWLRPQIIDDTEEHQRQLAEIIASRTEDYLLASSRSISGAASVFSKKLVGPERLQEYLDAVLASSTNLSSLTFTDADGRITAIAYPLERASLQREMIGIDLSLTGAVRQVRASGKPSWSDAYLSPVCGGVAVAYATPGVDGVALGEISLNQLSNFLRDIVAEGKQSVFIIDRRGQVIADQEGRYTARQYNLTNLEIVREGLGSDKPMTRRYTFNGTKVVGCIIKAPLLDWSILVATPVNMAYRSALTTTGIFATALCMALLLAYGLALFMSQSLARGFEKLVSHARRIESGDKVQEWPRATVSEFNILGDAFQAMANTLCEREVSLDTQLHFLQQLLDSIPIPVFYKDTGGLYLGCNAAFETFIGKSKTEIIGKTVSEVAPKEHAEKYFEADLALFRNPGVQVYETCGMYHDGQFHDVIFNKATFVDADNRVAGIVVALIDITPLRNAEENLRESEEKFRVLAETSPSAIILHQGEKFIYTNPATTKISGYSEAELLEMNFWEFGGNEHGESIKRRGLARLEGGPEPPQYEHKLITKSGEEKWVLISAGVIDYRGTLTVIATLLDITETKVAEKRMEVALAEKEVLLKEVHHRVKNNMQIISSLLDLQSDYLPDERLRTCIRESQNRIRSMALIHERLYQSKNFSSIDVGEYIRDLSHHLFSSYAVETGRITLNIDTENICLEINRAVPCGLIINELISNTLKHAFPDGQIGEVSVRVSSEGGIITLEAADTGVGLPSDLDLKNSETLGLQLVAMLVQQLKGRLSFEEGQPGSVFVISFPEK